MSTIQKHNVAKKKTTSERPASAMLLHFTGAGLYGPKRFINEAKRLGVQRVIPFNMLSSAVKFGQPILLADGRKTPRQLEDGKIEQVPTALIYGYFNVENLSYVGMPGVIRERMLSKLKVEEVSDGGGQTEMRACGSYGIGATYTVNNSLAEIVEAIKAACRELSYEANKEFAIAEGSDKKMEKEDFEAYVKSLPQKYLPTDYKYFLKGPIKEFTAPVVLYGCKFSRGYKYIDAESIKENIETTGDNRHALFELLDYERRSYLTKEDRDRIDHVILDEFVESKTN